MSTATKSKKGFELLTADLKRALVICGRVVSSRSPKPILKNVRVGEGLMTATDLDVMVDVTLDYHGESFLLPYERLRAIVDACGTEQIRLHPDGSRCVVTAGRGRWEIPTEDVAEFPAWSVEAKPLVRLPADQFARAVRSVVFATDNESSRYALGAVLVTIKGGNPTLVATDGRRLATYECETDQAVDDAERLVPARVMQLLASVADHDEGSVQLESTENELVAQVADVTVTARLVDGRFPRWSDVFPSREVERTVVRCGDLLSAVRQAAIVESEASKGITLTFAKAGITLSGRSSEYGESEVKCAVDQIGTACTTKLDPSFLIEWLRQIDSAEMVEIDVADSTSAAVFRCEDSRYVVMPMSV